MKWDNMGIEYEFKDILEFIKEEVLRVEYIFKDDYKYMKLN